MRWLACSSTVAPSCPILCNPMSCSRPVSSVHGILQASILECVAISSSRGSSWPGIEPRPLCWKLGILATGPPGKSLETWQVSPLNPQHKVQLPAMKDEVVFSCSWSCFVSLGLPRSRPTNPALSSHSTQCSQLSTHSLLHGLLTPLSLYTCSSLEWDPTPSSPSQAQLLLQHQSTLLTPSLSGWVPFLRFHTTLCSARYSTGLVKKFIQGFL